MSGYTCSGHMARAMCQKVLLCPTNSYNCDLPVDEREREREREREGGGQREGHSKSYWGHSAPSHPSKNTPGPWPARHASPGKGRKADREKRTEPCRRHGLLGEQERWGKVQQDGGGQFNMLSAPASSLTFSHHAVEHCAGGPGDSTHTLSLALSLSRSRAQARVLSEDTLRNFAHLKDSLLFGEILL